MQQHLLTALMLCIYCWCTFVIQVPLKEASVDIAVFCLSLMGTNTLEYIAEASRVLKLG